MLTVDELPSRRLVEYEHVAGPEVVEDLFRLAEPLRGARVLHVNATAFGGGVAELLTSLVPLMRDAGLDCHWQVLEGPPEFFATTKTMHNALQGAEVCWSSAQAEIWRSVNRCNARAIDDSWDYVVVHDAQPAAILASAAMDNGVRPQGRWTWRCHVDLTDASSNVWNFLAPYVAGYDAGIFSMPDYVRPGLSLNSVRIVPPAIDPLSEKNRPVEKVVVRGVLERYGIDLNRPIMLQVSRFDPWKDPVGVIDAYRLARTEVRTLQLLMIGSMADDDPEGWEWYERTVAHAGGDEDIHVYTNLDGVNAHEVNCFQRAADVVVQNSTREGFGLVVSEALWKERPVVARDAGGIPIQIRHGESGHLITTSEECADSVVHYLKHPEERRAAGAAGRARVRDHFLITRYLGDYLALFNDLGRRPAAEVVERAGAPVLSAAAV
ncbi:MAG: glycosyltransferase [Dehalococcoidia bacterium]